MSTIKLSNGVRISYENTLWGVNERNVLYENQGDGDRSYIAIQDCWCVCYSEDNWRLAINGITIWDNLGAYQYALIFIKKGQQIEVHNKQYASTTRIKAFGLK